MKQRCFTAQTPTCQTTNVGVCEKSQPRSGLAFIFASYNRDMKQEVVLRTLKQKNAELMAKFGVKSLLLFGSVARNEATSTSDVDLLVEFNRPVGYFGLFALQDYLEKLLGCSVDLGTPDSLKPYIKERVMGELIRVT